MTHSPTTGLDAGRLDRLDAHLRAYVDDGRLPGFHVQVNRHGQVAHSTAYGRRDMATDAPITPDTLYRIYSMTKPITTVAAMMLYERAALDLSEPVSKYVPAFEDVRVYVGGPAPAPVTRPATEPIRIKHLMTHTAGLTYGFHRVHVTDEILRGCIDEFAPPAGTDLAKACDLYAQVPLRFDPGTSWNYSVATDVLGRVVEVVSGQSLDDFFRDHILGPLEMSDTAFHAVDVDRLATLYGLGPDGIVPLDQIGRAARSQPAILSGGGGLVSSMADYTRFTDLLLHGGRLGDVRLLSDRTVSFMTRNHLPGGADLDEFGIPLFAETPFRGVGFGLGFSVTIDPVRAALASSAGEFGWGGMASTYFWVDPAEDMTIVFMTQVMPSSAYPVRSELKQLVYSALVE
ncbi:serine hydrolase domain-containing protein [Leekyejoonella antrihumi]|uniref:Beta-lactamase family protein n=1 Tax=Leekyejoonella antrihumi TaxID=1660198 RepID=A0A563E121_9MICO|nr:serine hydrolase domain-containing protein [Leekyejoonella antrihumi]TWP35594.1 beta-lactamase family protein [Leekyejoonella antrihumi]